MKAQVLYNLRNCTGFIAGTDLHQLFVDLLGTPSPSGNTEMPSIPESIKGMLNQRVFSTIEDWDGKWHETNNDLTIEEATEQAQEDGAIVVSTKTAQLMQDKLVSEVQFDSGYIVSANGATPAFAEMGKPVTSAA